MRSPQISNPAVTKVPVMLPLGRAMRPNRRAQVETLVTYISAIASTGVGRPAFAPGLSSPQIFNQRPETDGVVPQKQRNANR
jgi:hypothetical protein